MANIDKILRSLTADINSGQCVLLVGPEILKIDDIALTQHLYRKLAQENKEDILHYYQQNGLFLFSEDGKEEIQREIRLFYEKSPTVAALDKSIYTKILSIPFHLVVSINPDAFLSDAAFAHNQLHRFAYFQNEGIAVEDVEEPTKAIPLFYNLCGSTAKDASLILDYDDLFRLMKAVFGSPGLPIKLTKALDTAKTFVCIGFDFEKWYTQLLLRLLSGDKGKRIKKYAIDTSIANESTQTFLVNQFGITFLGEELEFFDALYNAAAEQNILRKIEPINNKQAHVSRLVQEGKTAEALDYLQIHLTDKDDLDMVVLLKGRFVRNEESKLKGTIDLRDYNLELNKINDAILQLSKLL